MKKVQNRSLSVMLLVIVALLGMGFYVVRYVMYGAQWASAPFNRTVFDGGMLAVGSVVDRNGVVLADVSDGRRTFAENADVRRATLHAVGDREGNIGTGALSVFASDLMGFNLITGSYFVGGAGREIELTIDAHVSAVALRALDGQRGVVMVSNFETGEIIAMVSSPTFDPVNPPATFDEGVFVNRGIQSAFTPGSVYKVITAAAAIEQVSNVFDRQFYCNGGFDVSGLRVTCPGNHGSLDIIRGMQVSCNVVYGQLALEIGGSTMARYAEQFGVSGRTTVSGIQTANGNFDAAPNNSADLAWSGIGQFTNTVCPASMLRFMGAIGNGGNAVGLHYIQRTGFVSLLPPSTERIMTRNTAQQLSEVIEIQNRQNFPGLQIYAKTGTAQVGGGHSPHAWFVGYITNPGFPYAFVVVVENSERGGGAAVAAPIANQVLQAAVGR